MRSRQCFPGEYESLPYNHLQEAHILAVALAGSRQLLAGDFGQGLTLPTPVGQGKNAAALHASQGQAVPLYGEALFCRQLRLFTRSETTHM